IKQVLLEKFNKDTSGKNDLGGKRILENDLISNFNVKCDDDLVYIDSKIISENYFNEYNSKMEIDINNKNIISTFCSCDDFERNELRKHNYCCKHLFASFYKFLNELDNNEEVKAKFNETLLNKIIFKS
ncbi:SWIM zinc finger family protein, partial [Clostridium tertium]